MNETEEKIVRHWESSDSRPVGWWAHPKIVQHINHRVCGIPLEGLSSGLVSLVQKGGHRFRQGISVGCGNGYKEMDLIIAGVTDSFRLYELSEKRIEQGRARVETLGLTRRVEFRQEDAFAAGIGDSYFDLVYWNNALHHMPDARQAVAWSRRILRNEGLFLMDDYVGPTRFQWSDAAIAYASAVRATLPERLLTNPQRPDGMESRTITRDNPERMAEVDPSEAADSDNILAAIAEHFPAAWIKYTGGVVYNCALSHMIQNFRDTPEDNTLLDALLLLDDVLLDVPGVESHYAVALAFKNAETTPSFLPAPSAFWSQSAMRQRDTTSPTSQPATDG